MTIRSALSILSSVMLCGCSPLFQGSKPVGVPFALPANLRICAEGAATTDPAAFLTVADLLTGYGIERTSAEELRACHQETVRLIDFHNQQMTSGKLPAK
jgi:hypothetical protein